MTYVEIKCKACLAVFIFILITYIFLLLEHKSRKIAQLEHTISKFNSQAINSSRNYQSTKFLSTTDSTVISDNGQRENIPEAKSTFQDYGSKRWSFCRVFTVSDPITPFALGRFTLAIEEFKIWQQSCKKSWKGIHTTCKLLARL